jgi:hypothetical protein
MANSGVVPAGAEEEAINNARTTEDVTTRNRFIFKLHHDRAKTLKLISLPFPETPASGATPLKSEKEGNPGWAVR